MINRVIKKKIAVHVTTSGHHRRSTALGAHQLAVKVVVVFFFLNKTSYLILWIFFLTIQITFCGFDLRSITNSEKALMLTHKFVLTHLALFDCTQL